MAEHHTDAQKRRHAAASGRPWSGRGAKRINNIIRRGNACSIAELWAIYETFNRIGSIEGTARALKINHKTARKYINEGDPARGV